MSNTYTGNCSLYSCRHPWLQISQWFACDS